MIVNIPLNKIRPNPWQTRVGDPDPEYIKELAMDIAKNGLLQAPAGRIMNSPGQAAYFSSEPDERKIQDMLSLADRFVELAFGHNRLAAYKWLYDLRDNSDIQGDYSTMPVQIRTMSDEQMAEISWSENEQRRDVTPIERAKAIEKRMADFGWSQNEVADHLGLARPTVSNILRLLKLPQNIQDALGRGEISARVASALLPMYELPKETLEFANAYAWNSPTRIVKDALGGASSDVIRHDIESLYQNYTRKLQTAEFGLDEMFPENLSVNENRVYCGLCRTCDRRLKHDGNVCLDLMCFNAKTTLHRRRYLAEASAASGYEVSDPDKGGQVTGLPYSDDRARKILATRCENLRLVYSQDSKKFPDDPRAVEGFPHAMIICDKRNNSCTCMKGLQIEERQPQPAPVTQIVNTDSEYDPALDATEDDLDMEYEAIKEASVRAQTPAAPSPKDLEELARQARKDKIEVGKKIEDLKGRVIDRLVEALNYDEPGVFYMIANHFAWPNDKDLADLQAIYRKIASNLTQYVMPNNPNSVKEALEFINSRLTTNRIEPVSLEKTLVEIYESEDQNGQD